MEENTLAEEKKVSQNLKLSSPWVIYHQKLAALFAEDPAIEIGQMYDSEGGNYEIWIYAHTPRKYDAVQKLLPESVVFGNVTVKHVIKLTEQPKEPNWFETVKDLFEGNGKVADMKFAEDAAKNTHMFIMFRPEVIQFFSDNTDDLNGLWNGLTQDIAREVVSASNIPGIHFNTLRIQSSDESMQR